MVRSDIIIKILKPMHSSITLMNTNCFQVLSSLSNNKEEEAIVVDKALVVNYAVKGRKKK